MSCTDNIIRTKNNSKINGKKWYASNDGKTKILHYGKWDDVKDRILKTKYIKYKSFKSEIEALAWLNSNLNFNYNSNCEFSIDNDLKGYIKKMKKNKIEMPEKETLYNNYDIHIYTDGSHIKGVKNSAAWAYIILRWSKTNQKYVEFEKRAKLYTKPDKTNNRVELKAILKALQLMTDYNLDNKAIMIYSDSEYSIKAITCYSKNWINNGWLKSDGEPVLNKDLIVRILDYIKMISATIKFEHVYSHQNNEYNNLVDDLAQTCAKLG